MSGGPARWSGLALEAALVLACAALPLSIAAANIGWALVLAAAAVRAAHVFRGGAGGAFPLLRASWTPLAAPTFAFCAAAALSAFLGTEPAYSALFLHKDFYKAGLVILIPAALSLARPETEARMLAASAAGYGALAVMGAVQGCAWRSTSGEWVRAHGFVHAVTYGNLVALGFTGMAAFLAAPRTGAAPGGRPPWLWALALAAAAALTLNQTRSAVAGALAGVCVFCVLLPRLRRYAAAALAAGLLALVFADLRAGRSLGGDLLALARGSAVETPQLDRLRLWRAAWAMFLDHPAAGVGINNYRSHYGRYGSGSGSISRSIGTAHNIFIHQLAERGLAGLAALAWLCAALWLRAWRRARDDPDPLNLWALGATAAFLVMNMTETALEVEQVWMAFFFIWLWAEKRHQAGEHPATGAAAGHDGVREG